MRKIKLIWDFRGVDAEQTARHHEIHLKEFSRREGFSEVDCGIEVVSDIYTIAYITVLERDMILVRDALLPHRGEVSS